MTRDLTLPVNERRNPKDIPTHLQEKQYFGSMAIPKKASAKARAAAPTAASGATKKAAASSPVSRTGKTGGAGPAAKKRVHSKKTAGATA